MKKSLITRLKSALCAVGLSVTLLTGQAYTCYAAATAAATAAVVVGGAVAISLVLAGLGLKSDGGDHPRFNDLVGKIAKNADVIKHTIGVGQAVEDVTKRGIAAYIKDGITYIPEAFAKSVAKSAIDLHAFDGITSDANYSNDYNIVNDKFTVPEPNFSSVLVGSDFIDVVTKFGDNYLSDTEKKMIEAECQLYNYAVTYVHQYDTGTYELGLQVFNLTVGHTIGLHDQGVYLSHNVNANDTIYPGASYFLNGISGKYWEVGIKKDGELAFNTGKFNDRRDIIKSPIGVFSTGITNLGVRRQSGIEAGFENTGSIPKQDGIGDDVSLPGNWAKPADIDVGLDTPIKAVPIDIGTSAKAAALAIPQTWTPKALAQTYGLAAGYGTKAIPNVPAIPRAKVWGGAIDKPDAIPIPAIPGNPAIPQEKVQNPTAEDTPTTPTPVPDTPIPAAGIPNQNNFMLPDSIKEKFPFCIPFDMAKAFQKLSTSGREAPKFDYKLRGVNGKEHYEFKVDLSNYDSAARVLRTGLYIVFVIGLAAASVYLIKH